MSQTNNTSNCFKLCIFFLYTIILHCSCSFDYLELFDGESTSSPSLGRFCSDIYHSISSSQRFLTLQFITDEENQGAGFKIIYNFIQPVTGKIQLQQFTSDVLSQNHHLTSLDILLVTLLSKSPKNVALILFRSNGDIKDAIRKNRTMSIKPPQRSTIVGNLKEN